MGDETRSRYAQYFVTDLPKFETMEGHHSPPPSWIYPNMFPGINMRVNGMDVSRIVRDPHADPHVHEDHPVGQEDVLLAHYPVRSHGRGRRCILCVTGEP